MRGLENLESYLRLRLGETCSDTSHQAALQGILWPFWSPVSEVWQQDLSPPMNSTTSTAALGPMTQPFTMRQEVVDTQGLSPQWFQISLAVNTARRPVQAKNVRSPAVSHLPLGTYPASVGAPKTVFASRPNLGEIQCWLGRSAGQSIGGGTSAARALSLSRPAPVGILPAPRDAARGPLRPLRSQPW